ncbi:MAG: bifunctional diaminohydroxyphosphoribosylaminopyrimidine deaminase/5-amino-6-(5-phosphoribosylamino)uracil reductase RibD [Planctomycetia bacterium]|nr:bifunctional diaminohydroxyphosphoribosylaminopyrimidine deaminase/5-amino-6-(5-phosphoribosylamino)uracil reductase RibD [Planctomycetia bacterium]
MFDDKATYYMRRALDLAERGRGCVEPNPMVGCVILRDGEIVGEGFHERFGGPHAEVNALRQAGERARGGVVYVTLEPCCHFGKTPPCADALLAAGVKKVVVAMQDPFPKVEGGGIQKLRLAGVEVVVGLCRDRAEALNLPYLKLLASRRPYLTAKWAMTLDGKIASRTGSSRWISSEASRKIAHELRSISDGILVGVGTVLADNPQLTVRLPMDCVVPRQPVRLVADSQLDIPLESALVQTARQTPVLILAGPHAPEEKRRHLEKLGCQIFTAKSDRHEEQLLEFLDFLGEKRMTNVLVEGGGGLLGQLFDLGQIDALKVFVAPKLVGGAGAISPLCGLGIKQMQDAAEVVDFRARRVEDANPDSDILIEGRIRYPQISLPDDIAPNVRLA